MMISGLGSTTVSIHEGHLRQISAEKKSSLSSSVSYTYTLQPPYNTVHYNTVLDITRFKDGFQKCIDYIEKQEFRGRRHRTCWRKSHRSLNQNVVIK